ARAGHATLLRATRVMIAGRLAEASTLAMAALAPNIEGIASLPAQFYAAQLYVPFVEAGRVAELEEPYAELASMYPALPIWRVGLALVPAECGRDSEARRALEAP